MTALWDTSVASRVQPGSDALAHALTRLAVDDPVAVAAPAVLEIVHGLQRRAAVDAQFAALVSWFGNVLADGTLSVVPFGGRAALIAGHIRSAIPHAPPGHRGDRRSKAMRQAAWLMDIQIAATAFAAGLDVVTENRADFEQIGEVLEGLYPAAPRLEISPTPF